MSEVPEPQKGFEHLKPADYGDAAVVHQLQSQGKWHEAAAFIHSIKAERQALGQAIGFAQGASEVSQATKRPNTRRVGKRRKS